MGYAELQVGETYRSRFGRTVLEADNVWFTLLTTCWRKSRQGRTAIPFAHAREAS